jgi:hypothetical protein
LAEKAVAAEKGTPRADFERHFGAVRGSPETGWFYRLGEGKIQLWFDGEPEVVRTAFCLEPSAPPPAEPRDFGQEARSVARADRAFLLAFLRGKARNAGPWEVTRLRAFVREYGPVMDWTPEELRQLFGSMAPDD